MTRGRLGRFVSSASRRAVLLCQTIVFADVSSSTTVLNVSPAKLQIGDQFGKTLLQRLRFAQLAQRHLRTILQDMADMPGQLRLVDDDLRIQRRSVDVGVARFQRNIRDNARLQCRAYEADVPSAIRCRLP